MNVIEFPWPPSCLMPNAKRRSHWRKYAGPAKTYRQACYWLTKASLIRPEPGLVPMRISFFPPDRRRRDDDGCIGAFKHGRDGMADAWKVDDHTFRPDYRFCDPIKGGKICVEVL